MEQNISFYNFIIHFFSFSFSFSFSFWFSLPCRLLRVVSHINRRMHGECPEKFTPFGHNNAAATRLGQGADSVFEGLVCFMAAP